MQLYSVFLSSTAKDLSLYRQAAKEAIDALDGFHCIRMEEFGSRDEVSETFCAKQVADCDVFVILLGHCYGSEVSGEGISYTEQEYQEALRHNRPVLRFAAREDFQVPANLIETASKRKKQQRFRNHVLAGWQCEFFVSPEDLARAIIAALHNWKEREAQRPPSPQEAVQYTAPHEIEPTAGSLVKIAQLVSYSSDEEVDSVDALRTFLVAHSLISRTTNEPLSVHEINLAYRFRDKLEIGPVALPLLHKTLFSDRDGIVPGWYWVDERTRSDLPRALWHLAYKDDSVRPGVLDLARRRAICLPLDPAGRHALLRELLEDKRAGVANIAASLLTVADDSELITWGEEQGLTRRPDVEVPFMMFQWQCRFAADPVATFEAALSSPGFLQRPASEIRPLLADVPTASLSHALGSGEAIARLVAATELLAREELTLEQSRLLANDSHLPLACLALKALIARGERISAEDIRLTLKREQTKDAPAPTLLVGPAVDVDDVIYESFLNLPEKELREKLGWLRPDGAIAYRVLGEYHFTSFGEELRLDLADSFASRRTKEFQAIRTGFEGEMRNTEEFKAGRVTEADLVGFVEQAVREVEQSYEQYAEFIEGQLVGSAMRGLVRNGRSDDVSFARRLLDDPKAKYFLAGQIEAVELISKFGNASDVNRLLELAKKSYGDLQRNAIQAALALSDDRLETAQSILNSPPEALYEIAIRALPVGKRGDKWLKHYMSDSNNARRAAAANEAARRWSPAKAMAFLKSYLERDSYYYNVVVTFDRALYAPKEVCEVFLP